MVEIRLSSTLKGSIIGNTHQFFMPSQNWLFVARHRVREQRYFTHMLVSGKRSGLQNKLHRAKPIFSQLVKYTPLLWIPKVHYCLQTPAIGVYFEPDESSPHAYTHFIPT
jgi:hypothetical protein